MRDRSSEFKEYLSEKRRRTKKKALNKARMIYFLIGDIIKRSGKIVDLGGGDGSIRQMLEKWSNKTIIGTDYEAHSLQYKKNFYQCDACDTPFKNEEFDLIIANGLYEHIRKDRQPDFIKECNRILKKGGYMYLFTCTKYSIIEPHTKLPFLGCIPRPLASWLAKLIMGRDFFDVYAPSYGEVVRDLSKYFKVKDVTLNLIYKPNDLNVAHKEILMKLPKLINKMLLRASPSIKLICRKV